MKASLAYLVAPLIVWVIAQAAKDILGAISTKQGSFTKYFRSGGMPSAHTAVVVTLATIIFAHEGLSELFVVVFWIASITIYDALVARHSIGEQGKALVKLLQSSKFSKDPLPHVALGHKPLEVAVGAALGVAVGIIVAFFITN